MTQTLIAHFRGWIELLFDPYEIWLVIQENKYLGDIFLFKKSLESPHWGHSNEYACH